MLYIMLYFSILNVSQSRKKPLVYASLVSPHNPTFLRENASYFGIEAESS